MPPRISVPLSFPRALPRRTLTTTSSRLNTGMPPHPTPQQPGEPQNAFKEGMSRYKAFASPYAKVFLGAVFTYQVIYWTWVKLEMEEVKVEKGQQLAALENQVREMTGVKK